MTDQEIRAKALELTIKAFGFAAPESIKTMVEGFKSSGDDHITYPFIYHCDRIEKYIRTGEKIK